VSNEIAPAFAAAYAPTEPFATRYLLLEPLAALVERSPWARDLFAAQIGRAAEWPMRARAAELAATRPELRASLARAVDDLEPRVREAALRSLAAQPGAEARAAAEKRLGGDPWTFVRVAAVGALAASPPDRGVDDRLEAALKDAAPKVRAEAALALGRRRAVTAGDKLEARAKDGEEEVEVRRAAIVAMGGLCDRRRLDYLTKVALRMLHPSFEYDVTLGVAAAQALGEIHPPDLGQRLAPMLDKSAHAEARRTAELAIAEPGRCR
jgi:HEAT repeat protein